MKATIDKNYLKEIIKEAVREVIKEEKINFFINSLPFVSDEEMKDIEKKYGQPEKKAVDHSEIIEI